MTRKMENGQPITSYELHVIGSNNCSIFIFDALDKFEQAACGTFSALLDCIWLLFTA